MTDHFDTELVEHTMLTTEYRVDIYKLGGGTVGRAYDGTWGYLIKSHDEVLAQGEDLYTGMPKTHEEAAEVALDICLTIREQGEITEARRQTS